jgi:hypothetical protein
VNLVLVVLLRQVRDGRLTHRSKHIPHLPILFSPARGNDRVLYLDGIVGPRLRLPATFREARAQMGHAEGVTCRPEWHQCDWTDGPLGH